MKKRNLLRMIFAVVSSLAIGLASAEEFADDVTFMKKHTEIILLQEGDAAVAVDR